MSDTSFRERFGKLQTELKAPKNLRNTFGNYQYRNTEGIFEAVKPLLQENRLLLTVTDDIVLIGDRYFVKATAAVSDMDSDSKTEATAFAQIDKHAGMALDQCVGCASSYARKYCLGGLLLLDDSKDEDSDEFKNEQTAKAEKENSMLKKPVSAVQAGALMKRIGDDTALLDYILKAYKVAKLDALTVEKLENINRNWSKILEAAHEGKAQQPKPNT